MAFDVIPRHVWGAEPAWGAVTDIGQVEGLTVHWEGATGSLLGVDPAQQLRAIQAKCKRTNYNDIFYSWAVSLDGRIWECRGWGRNSAANGSTDGNDHYYAVCVLMGMADHVPNEVKTSIGAIADTVGGKVLPHSFFFNTACPGDELRSWISLGYPHDVPLPLPEDDMADPQVLDVLNKIAENTAALTADEENFSRNPASNGLATINKNISLTNQNLALIAKVLLGIQADQDAIKKKLDA